MIILHEVFDDEHKFGGAQINIEGDYIWRLRLLKAVAVAYRYVY